MAKQNVINMFDKQENIFFDIIVYLFIYLFLLKSNFYSIYFFNALYFLLFSLILEVLSFIILLLFIFYLN